MKSLKKYWVGVCFSGFLIIVLGAFGGHVLQYKLDPNAFRVFGVAVHYQMFQTLSLMGCLLYQAFYQQTNIWALRFFALGLVLFCGSLYALVFTDLPMMGLITPFGGFSFLLGWGFWIKQVLKK